MNLLRRPLVQDTGLALGLLIASGPASGIGLTTEPVPDGGTDIGFLWWICSTVAAIAIALRRRWPVVFLPVATVAVALHMTMGVGAVFIDLAVPILLAGVAQRHGRALSITILAVLIVGAGLWNLSEVLGPEKDGMDVSEAIGKVVAIPPAPRAPVPPGRGDEAPPITSRLYVGQKSAGGVLYGSWGGLPVLAPVLIAGWAFGSRARARRALVDELTAHARHLEDDRDQSAALAAAEERARIGRELHDAVAHGLSVMVVQAQGAEAALDKRPADTRKALQAIVDVGRRSLADMRRTLNAHATPDLAPTPGLDRLEELARRVTDSGTPVRLILHNGVMPQPPASVDLSAYRIVQEALTNVVKHAGPGAEAVVEIESTPDALVLTITDTGSPAGTTDGQGHGLRGMRERAALLGGTLDAGPAPEGGFRVTATLPVRFDSPSDTDDPWSRE